jgi:hypothetical protein
LSSCTLTLGALGGGVAGGGVVGVCRDETGLVLLQRGVDHLSAALLAGLLGLGRLDKRR